MGHLSCITLAQFQPCHGLRLHPLGGQCLNKPNMNTALSLQYYLNICSENSTTNMHEQNDLNIFMFCWNFE